MSVKMGVEVGDRYILHSSNGMDYTIEIISVNRLRPRDMIYAADMWDAKGNHSGDVEFFGDDFFEKNKDKLDKIELL